MNAGAVVDEYYRMLASRDRPGLHALLSPEIEVVYHAQPHQLPWAGRFHGREGFDEFLSRVADVLEIVDAKRSPPIQNETHLVVQTIGTWRVKQSGAEVHGAMLNVFTIDSGLIAGYEVYADTAAFFEALNVS